MKRFPLVLSPAVFLLSCAQHKQTAMKAPSTPSAMERQVMNAVDAGDGDIELQTLRAQVIAQPANLESRLELGKAYERRGYPELALDHYRWATEHSPESADAHLFLARALDHTGHSEEAIQALSAFLTEHPQPNPTLYSWLGIMRDDAKDWTGSEQAYREAMAKSAEYHDYLHNNLGYSLLKQGRTEEAAKEFRAALKLNPHSEIARDNLALALAASPRAADTKEAILNWQSLNDPASAHSNLAAVLIEQGKYAEARKELEIALQYNQNNSAALKNFELLSDLDGKPVAVKVVEPRTHWSRVKSAWHRFLSGGAPSPAQNTTETASGRTPTTSESKQ